MAESGRSRDRGPSVFQTDRIDFNRHIYLCMAYALWDKAEQALPHCQEITRRQDWPDYLQCAYKARDAKARGAEDARVGCAENPLLTAGHLFQAKALTRP